MADRFPSLDEIDSGKVLLRINRGLKALKPYIKPQATSLSTSPKVATFSTANELFSATMRSNSRRRMTT